MFNHEHAVAAHDEGQPPRAALSHITTTLTRTRSPITTTNVAQQTNGSVDAPRSQ